MVVAIGDGPRLCHHAFYFRRNARGRQAGKWFKEILGV
jgi:hypothetical protein